MLASDESMGGLRDTFSESVLPRFDNSSRLDGRGHGTQPQRQCHRDRDRKGLVVGNGQPETASDRPR